MKAKSAQSNRHILLVAHNLGEEARAGTESYCLNLGRALAELGVQVSFLAPQGPPFTGPQPRVSWRSGKLAGLPFLTFTHTNQDLGANLRHPGFETAFREILQSHPVDVVHFHHTYLSSISLLEVAREAGLPVVLTLHDAWHLCPRLHCLNDQGLCNGPESLEQCTACLEYLLHPITPENRAELAKFLAQRLAYVKKLLPGCRLLAPSRFMRNLHYRYGVARGDIIHLPLGLDELGPIPQEEPLSPPKFVFLGNIVAVKRVDLAVEAFTPLGGQATLEIWGQLLPQFERQFLESIAPHPHITYQGSYRRQDLPGILAGVTATVITSDFENCPLVVRESLMLKVPVIASQAGGIPEIIQHGKNGLLFPTGDVKALRRRIRQLIRRPELARRLRQEISPVKTIGQEALELLDLYHSLIFRRRSPTALPNPGVRNADADLPFKPEKIEEVCEASSRAAMKSSIIIPAFNNLELTRNCLESIKNHTEPGSYELIVVDNGSSDGTRQFLQEQAAQRVLSPIFNSRNLGFSAASNQGALAATGNCLVFLNNDTIVQPGWLPGLTRGAAKGNKIAAVGAKLLYPDETVQHAGVVFSPKKKVYHIYRFFHRDHPAVNKEREFKCLTAACLLVKKEVFFQVGSFDEQFMNGFEDVDLCLKMASRGYTLLYTPGSMVYHLESKTPGRHAKERENAHLLASRWYNRIFPDDESYYWEDGIMVVTTEGEDGSLFALMYDANENPFWREAVRLRNQGSLQEASEYFLTALKFNPYDTRRWLIGLELIEVLKRLGRQREAQFYRHNLAQQSPFALYFRDQELPEAAGL